MSDGIGVTYGMAGGAGEETGSAGGSLLGDFSGGDRGTAPAPHGDRASGGARQSTNGASSGAPDRGWPGRSAGRTAAGAAGSAAGAPGRGEGPGDGVQDRTGRDRTAQDRSGQDRRARDGAAGRTAGIDEKAADGKTPEGAAPGPSHDYSVLTLPEGYRASLDDPVFSGAVKLFGDNGIAPDVAQKLIDFTIDRDRTLATALNEQSAQHWQKQVEGWKANSRKEFGPEDLGHARMAMPRVFDTETARWLDSLGLTNHPGFIRAMVKVARAIRDDTWTSGNAARGPGADARGMYPNSNMNP